MSGWKFKDLDSSEVINLKHGDIFGRSEGTYQFPDCPKMSRQHCQITIDKNFAYIQDLGSRNGTYVNSEKTDPNSKVLLCNGHIVMFGGKTYMVKGGEEHTSTHKGIVPGMNSGPVNRRKR